MRVLQVLLWLTFIGSAFLLIFLLFMDLGVLPIRGTGFSRSISHVSAVLCLISSAYQLFVRNNRRK